RRARALDHSFIDWDRLRLKRGGPSDSALVPAVRANPKGTEELRLARTCGGDGGGGLGSRCGRRLRVVRRSRHFGAERLQFALGVEIGGIELQDLLERPRRLVEQRSVSIKS